MTKLYVALGVFLFGLLIGYQYEHAKFEEYITKVDTEAKVAEAVNKEVVRKQEAITQSVTKEYANAVKKITTHYTTRKSSGVHNTQASGNALPQDAQTSQGVDGEAKVTLPDSTGDCALDALQLLSLQNWLNSI